MRTRALPLLLCAFLCSAPSAVHSQGVDIRIVAPSAPGSGWDHVAQALRGALAEKGGLEAVVTNKPGRAGVLGLGHFLATHSDTDLLVTGLTMLDASVLGRSGAEFARLRPIARLSAEPYGLVVPVNSPLKSLDDLRAALLTEPARLAWAGGPSGGVDHVAAILLGKALGISAQRLNYVPFLTSAEAGIAAAEERVGIAMLALGEIQREIAAGRLRLLGVSAAVRLPGLDAPTLSEGGIPLEFANWRGVMAGPALSAEQQDRLAKLVRSAVDTRVWQQMLQSRSWQDAFLAPEPFAAFVGEEHRRVQEALKAAGLLKKGD